MRPKLTYANVMVTILAFIVLGGGAYAAVKLPKNSVGTKQLKQNAVTSAKVKDHSLKHEDFEVGQLPQGAPGPAGSPGPPGADGTALGYADIADLGGGEAGLDTSKSKGVISAVYLPTYSVWCFDLSFVPKNVVASTKFGSAGSVVSTGLSYEASIEGCPAADQDAMVKLSSGGVFFALFN